MAKLTALTRRQAKALTRQRLLDCALAILDEQGQGGLTTTAVTRRAGIAQSTFYVHFTDVDDLLRSLVAELAAERSRRTRAARRAARAAQDGPTLRDTFRVPLADMLAHPVVSRLLLASRADDSPLGEWSRLILEHSRSALIEDLAAAGLRMDTPQQRRRAAMIADAVTGMTEALALGYLEGRYTDVEDMVDTLCLFSAGYLGELGGLPGSPAG